MQYDSLSPFSFKQYLNNWSNKDLKVGDTIEFLKSGDIITPESLAGRRIKVRCSSTDAFEGTIDGFNARTGKHQVKYNDHCFSRSYNRPLGDYLKDSNTGTKWINEGKQRFGMVEYDFKNDKGRNKWCDRFVFDGIDVYYFAIGECIIREL
jgi:hypothetical protein